MMDRNMGAWWFGIRLSPSSRRGGERAEGRRESWLWISTTLARLPGLWDRHFHGRFLFWFSPRR